MTDACIRCGYFPSVWKQGVVIPVPKGNSERTHKAFRPVTLLPIAGKCIEKVYIDRAREQIASARNWCDAQFGFTKKRSTVDAILGLTDTLKTNKAAGKSSLIVSLDISGAFDNVSHAKLVEQMTVRGSQKIWYDLLDRI